MVKTMFNLISIEFYIHAMVALISCSRAKRIQGQAFTDFFLFSKKKEKKEKKKKNNLDIS